jgi:hypothetical protein
MKIFCFLILSLSAKVLYSKAPDTNAVKSIDGIVNAVLKTLSLPEKTEKDWDLMKDFFAPHARFNVLFHMKDGTKKLNSFTVEEFIEKIASGSSKGGFVEYEIKKTVEEYNGIAQVFQSYQVIQGEHKEKGINSYQLAFDGQRWRIVNILWTSDRNGVSLPERYIGD